MAVYLKKAGAWYQPAFMWKKVSGTWQIIGSEWGQSKGITFPMTTKTNVQVRLVLTPANFDYATAKADGSDIRFTLVGGVPTAPLPYWIESWNAGGTSVVWFKVPTVNTGSAVMWSLNPLAVDAQTPFIFFMEKGLRWQSFTGTELAGAPTFGGNDLALDMPASSGTVTISGQAVGTTNMSARWDGWWIPEHVGLTYFEWASHDDGSRAWIDGQVAYSNWAAGGTDLSLKTFTDIKPKAYRHEFNNVGGNGQYRMGVGTRTGRRVNLIPNPSFEVDMVGWLGGGVRDTTRSFVGAASAKFTRAGSVTTTMRYLLPAHGGVTYAWWVYMYLTSAVTNLYLDVVFYDAAMATLADGANVGPAATYNSWQKVGGVYTAPANTAFVEARIVWDGGVNGDVWIDACMLEWATVITNSYFDGQYPRCGWYGTPNNSESYYLTTPRINAIVNPRAAIDLTGISRSTVDCTVTRRTDDGVYGSTCFEVTQDVVGQGGLQTDLYAVPTMVGDPWCFSYYMKALNHTQTITMALLYYAADGVTVVWNDANTFQYTPTTVWERRSHLSVTPAGAAFVRARVRTFASTTPVGAATRLSGLMLERSGSLGSYLDGSIAPCLWTGTPHASHSLVYPSDRGNLVPNPGPAANTAGWIVLEADVTGTWMPGGRTTGYLKAVKSTAVVKGCSFEMDPAFRIPVIPGVVYTASEYAKSPNTTSYFAVGIRWYDAAGTEISATWAPGAQNVTLTTAWQRAYVVGTAPAGAMYAGMVVINQQTAEVGKEVHFSDMLFEGVNGVGVYFDGATLGCQWAGTPNLSGSRKLQTGTGMGYPMLQSQVFSPKQDPAFVGPISAQSAVLT